MGREDTQKPPVPNDHNFLHSKPTQPMSTCQASPKKIAFMFRYICTFFPFRICIQMTPVLQHLTKKAFSKVRILSACLSVDFSVGLPSRTTPQVSNFTAYAQLFPFNSQNIYQTYRYMLQKSQQIVNLLIYYSNLNW